ncbi:Serine carboxypeptidase-like 26 [Hibiscus syriacus]|uniref:Serine carboxypeptidase-like 26 n=1 Tax=Hibiscus syriacus TaxID=106335 RepID=A0A6A3AWP6_HIBSY|nr:uncharacterized protein LOC120122054 [Hibiscus syriacus]KAE8707239.1 Serine carboxypeptidase-like 26 [Hibiscus syriacus]
MEMMVPVSSVDFNFDSACSSPYMTAPSSPQRFGNFFFSAPTSPTHVSSQLVEKPTTNDPDDDGENFEFNFSGQLERASLSADELFDGGKIRPLKPQPCFQHLSSGVSSPKSKEQQQQRVRETGSLVRKKSRSLSPLRVCDIMLEQEEEETSPSSSHKTTANNPKSSYVSSILSKVNRKWKLKDLWLFRSASEGRAASKDPLRKYSLLSRKEAEDVRNASFRSTDSMGSVSSCRRRGAISAHELHYTANRAVSEEMKRKTFLPYKQGLLGCLGFNHGMHQISRGIGSLTRS